MKSNLFNSTISSLCSFVIVALAIFTVPPLIEWAVFNAVWNAGSYDECRAIIEASHGKGASGACWAVLHEYFDTLVFGIYPAEHYWRAALALVLLGVSLVPVVLGGLPRWTFLLSALAVLAASVLIFGGFGLELLHSNKVSGLLLMIFVAYAGIIAAVPTGIGLAFCSLFTIAPLRMISLVIIKVTVRLPLIVVLIFMVIGGLYFLTPAMWPDLMVRIVAVMGLHAGAHMAIELRGEIKAMPQELWEAARASGLSHFMSVRLIILPLALKRAGPQFVEIAVGVIRDTTLLTAIGLITTPMSLFNFIRADQDWHNVFWEIMLVGGLVFGVICFCLYLYGKHLRRRLEIEGCNRLAIGQPLHPRASGFSSPP